MRSQRNIKKYYIYFFNVLLTKKKKVGDAEHKMRVLITFATLSETFLILRRFEQDMIKNVYRSAACKVP